MSNLNAEKDTWLIGRKNFILIQFFSSTTYVLCFILIHVWRTLIWRDTSNLWTVVSYFILVASEDILRDREIHCSVYDSDRVTISTIPLFFFAVREYELLRLIVIPSNFIRNHFTRYTNCIDTHVMSFMENFPPGKRQRKIEWNY